MPPASAMLRTAALLCLVLALIMAGPSRARADEIDLTPPDSASRTDGLAAFDRIFEVTSHPRCANCHVGADNIPMWSGPSYGRTRPHGMNIKAGDSRIGAEFIPCSACHGLRETVNDTPHAAPQVAMTWQLAPVEAEWFGKDASQICNQLRDPDRNGGRDMHDLAAHLDHDLILHWAWTPGGGREPAPYSLQAHIKDILIWGVAGMPCPGDD